MMTYTVTAVRNVLSLNQNTTHSVSNIKLPPFNNNTYTEMCLLKKRFHKLNCCKNGIPYSNSVHSLGQPIVKQ